MFKRIRIRTNILLHFLFLLAALSVTIIATQYHFSKELANDAVNRTFHQTAHKVAVSLQQEDRLSKEILYQLQSHPQLITKVDRTLPLETIRHFIHTLKRHPDMYAIYFGFANGDFFEVINMHIDGALHTHYNAPQKTRWTVVKIYNDRGQRIRSFDFLDDSLKVLASRREPSNYVVNGRPWYDIALRSDSAVRSDPYLFSNLQQKGITYSKTVDDVQTVLALDFTLESMHKILRSMKFSETGELFLFSGSGTLFGSSLTKSDAWIPYFQKLISQRRIDTVDKVSLQNRDYFITVIPLSKELGKETFVGISISAEEMFAPYKEKLYYSLAIVLLFLLGFVPVSLYLTDHIIRPIKALMKENETIKRRAFDEVKPVDTNIVEFIELSDSQIALSKSIQRYQNQLEELLDAFIQLIADAIDAKSPYTGSHCKKVPVLAMMLADAAESSDIPALRDFHFKSEEERKAFERAAWLHDCGKITTPEFVVDKATKLETIYNRIHEIRTRFEVLWRDIRIEACEKRLSGEDETQIAQWEEEQKRLLQEEFAFVAACNNGKITMDEKALERLERIASRTWLRYFDDSLGLSKEEERRYGESKNTLPTKERLIADKPFHRIPRQNFDAKRYEEQGFKLSVPTYLYNRGEHYNLSIETGTLTPEERYKINEHVIMTVKMLESLPFPDSMRDIPRYAGEHHEHMDGRGYPRSLGKNDIPIPSRIVAIADIFEALTASDRPYKEAKTLSEALHIMYEMKTEGHIDGDLFNLFIRSGIYKTYARQYLKEEQLDEVDEAALLS